MTKHEFVVSVADENDLSRCAVAALLQKVINAGLGEAAHSMDIGGADCPPYVAHAASLYVRVEK